MEIKFEYEKPALNIGSGSVYLDGWTNIEKYKNSTHHKGETAIPDVYGDAEDLPFEDGSFNTIYLRHVLEHLEQPLICLSECYRVLNNGGMIRIEVPDAQRVNFERPEHLYSWTEWTLNTIVKCAGFEVKKYIKIGNISHCIIGTKGVLE